MVNCNENYVFSRLHGGGVQHFSGRGVQHFTGGGGPIVTSYGNLWLTIFQFPGGGGVSGPPVPLLDPRMLLLKSLEHTPTKRISCEIFTPYQGLDKKVSVKLLIFSYL